MLWVAPSIHASGPYHIDHIDDDHDKLVSMELYLTKLLLLLLFEVQNTATKEKKKH